MLKITINVTENKDNESCSVKIINPKDLSKSSEAEQKVGAMIINALQSDLEKKNNKKGE